MRDASYMDTLDALARIRDVCQGELSLPQLCVVGDQSSGKSSLVRANCRGRRLYRRRGQRHRRRHRQGAAQSLLGDEKIGSTEITLACGYRARCKMTSTLSTCPDHP